MAKKISNESARFKKAIKNASTQEYEMSLYVAGMTPRSVRAMENIKKICDEHLNGRYQLEIIDIYRQPLLAQGAQIIAAPTLVKKSPLPLRRFIGDMSGTDDLLRGLDLKSGTRRPVQNR